MLKKDLENLLKRDGFVTNYKILADASEEETQEIQMLLEDMVQKNQLQAFMKDGVFYYKERTGTLC